MLYVLNQRLEAQNVEKSKAEVVMRDIITTLFDLDSYKEMAQAQLLYTKEALRLIFRKIVHCSIMKVNEDSMDKLFDLMVMSVKYQVLKCNSPKELLHIVLNHLDATLDLVSFNALLVEKVKKIFDKLVEMYGKLSMTQYILLKQALLCFMQGSNNKVSIYLALKLQNDEGRFVIEKEGVVPEDYAVPGMITIYKTDQSGKVTSVKSKFDTDCHFEPSTEQYLTSNFSDKIGGTRCTQLGTNIYKIEHDSATALHSSQQDSSTAINNSRYAQAEIGLLAEMMGSEKREISSVYEFKLTFFDDETEDQTKPKVSVQEQQPNVVSIVPTKSGTEALSQIAKDLTIKPSKRTSKGEDLLNLMDS